jgi:hypothetical protein
MQFTELDACTEVVAQDRFDTTTQLITGREPDEGGGDEEHEYSPTDRGDPDENAASGWWHRQL